MSANVVQDHLLALQGLEALGPHILGLHVQALIDMGGERIDPGSGLALGNDKTSFV